MLVDTIGLIWAVVVHPANIQDRDGAKLVFTRAKINADWTRMQRVWADGGYAGKLIAWVSARKRTNPSGWARVKAWIGK